MQSSAGVIVDSEGDIFTTGSGGLFRVAGAPLAETSFDSNGNAFQFATAIAFDPGSQPFEGFSGPDGGRLAFMADFGFAIAGFVRHAAHAGRTGRLQRRRPRECQ